MGDVVRVRPVWAREGFQAWTCHYCGARGNYTSDPEYEEVLRHFERCQRRRDRHDAIAKTIRWLVPLLAAIAGFAAGYFLGRPW